MTKSTATPASSEHRLVGCSGTRASSPSALVGVDTRYARYVGRVGALAVALGVGMAVATGYGTGVGVAWGDDTAGTNENAPAVDAPTDGAGATEGDAALGGADGAGPTAGDGASGAGVDVGGEMNVESSGGPDSSDNDGGQSTDTTGDDVAGQDAGGETAGEEVADLQPEPSPESVQTPAAVTTAAPKKPAHKNDSYSMPRGGVASIAGKTALDTGSVAAVTLNAVAPGGSRDSLAAQSRVAGSQPLTANRLSTVADESAARSDDPGALVSVASAMMQAIFSPLLSSGPGGPVEPPLAWALLAWARRETERSINTLTNVQPQATTLTVDEEPGARMSSFAAAEGDVVANTDAYATAEDTALTINAAGGVLANDTGVMMSATKLTDPSFGAVTLNSDGSFTYTPAANFTGTDSFIYEASDGTTTSAAQVILNVTAVNDAPTAVADNATMTANIPRTLTAAELVGNDQDPDFASGDTLSVNSVGGATNGTVKLNADGTVTFTPTANYAGPASFIYRVKDSTGTTSASTAKVSLTINPNQAPIAVADTATLTEGTARTFTANELVSNDYDPDTPYGDTLKINSVAGPTHGTVKLNADGTVTFTPTTNYAGPASFIYRVKDAAGTTSANTAKVTITVTGVNDAPTAVADSHTVTANVARTLTINDLVGNDTDPDTPYGDTLTINSVGGATNGTVKLNADGAVTFTPTTNYIGPASFIYRVKDSTGTTSANTAKVTLTVKANEAPTAVDDSATVTRNITRTLTAAEIVGNDTDPDKPNGDTLKINSVAGATHGTVKLNTDGTVTFTPETNYTGPASFIYRVKDASGTTSANTAKVNLTIKTNEAPTAVTDNVTLTRNVVRTLSAAELVANDTDPDKPNGDTLKINSVAGATHGTVKLNADGTVTFTPETNYTGPASFIYRVKDASGTTSANTAKVTLTFKANEAPTAVTDIATVTKDVARTFSAAELVANDTDPDMTYGDTLSVASVGGAIGGAAVLNADGTITFTPETNYTGPASFTYRAKDTTGDISADPARVYVTVKANEAPTAVADTATVIKDVARTFNAVELVANDNDPDKTYGDTLKINSVAGATHGTVKLNTDGTVTFTPQTNYTGPASFIYRVKDTNGATSATTAKVSLSINPAGTNNTPTAGTTTLGAPNTTTGEISGTVTGVNDPDGDPITFSAPATTTKGTVSINPTTGAFTYTPAATARHNAAKTTATTADKQDTFTITATDNHGATRTIPVTVTVLANNTNPTIATAVVGDPHPSTGVVSATIIGFSDPDGDALNYTVSPPFRGTATVNPTTRVLTYTPTAAARQKAASFLATPDDMHDTIVLTANDGHGGVNSVTLNVAVLPANNSTNGAPIAGTPVVGTPNASTGVVKGTTPFTDPDNDALTYTVTTYTTKGDVTVNQTTGAFTYTPWAGSRHDAAADTATAADKLDTFTVTASDQRGQQTVVTVTVPIVSQNTNPRTDIAPTVNASNASGVVTGNLYFYDNTTTTVFDQLTYTASTPAKGTVTITPNELQNFQPSFTYTPSAAARQQAASPTATAADMVDTFTVTANDGHGGTSVPVTLTVPVLPAGATPNGPIIGPAPQFDSRNTATGATTGHVLFYDNDDDTFTFTASTPAKGAVTINPTTNEFGDSVVAFTYTPTAAARHNATVGGATYEDTHDTFSIIAVDGHGNVTSTVVTVPVGVQNAKPILGTTTVGTPNSSTGVVMGTVAATDPDNDAITFVGPTATPKGSVTVDRTTGIFTYTPAPAARSYAAASDATATEKTDTFTVIAYDNHGDFVSTVVTVPISPSTAPNRAPVQTAPTTIGAADPITGEVSGNFHLTDPDQDGITYTIQPIAGSRNEDGFFVVDDPNFTVDGTTGAWTFTPTDERRHEAAQETGGRPDIYSFRWTATDSRGATTSGEVSVPIVPANQAPMLSQTTQTRNTSTGVFTGTFTAVDADEDYVDVSIVIPPTYGTATTEWVGGSTYQWIYTPAADQPEDYVPAFQYQLVDGHGYQTLITVFADGAAPTSTLPPITTGRSSNRPDDPTTGAIRGNITVPNPAGHTLTYTVTGTPAGGTVNLNQTTGAYTFTPDPTARHGAATTTPPATALTGGFTVTVKDGTQTVAVVPITVPISPLNRRPTTQRTVQPPESDGTVHGQITATDPDGDSLAYTASTTTRLGGTASINSDGSFTYTPTNALRLYAAEHPDTKDYFFVTITEGNGRKTYVRVPVNIAPLHLPPAPLDPPRYPPPPPDAGGASGGSSQLPLGPPVADIDDAPGRIVLTDALQIETTDQYVEIIYNNGVPGTGGIAKYHRSVTVTRAAVDDNVGDIYVIQLDSGVVTGYQKIDPGQTITGEEIYVVVVELGCGDCNYFTKTVKVVPFASGTFPTDLFPGGGPTGGGTPITGPVNPFDPFEDDPYRIDRDLAYRRTACLISPLVGGTATVFAHTPQGGFTSAGIIDKLGRIPGISLGAQVTNAQVELGHQCIGGDDGGD